MQRRQAAPQLREGIAEPLAVVASGHRRGCRRSRRRGEQLPSGDLVIGGAWARALAAGVGDGARLRRRRVIRTHPRQEVHAFDQLHGEKEAAFVFDQLAQTDEVGMLEILHRAELLLEAAERVSVGVPQRLERDHGVLRAVERFVHHAHAARAETPEDGEPPVTHRCDGADRHGRSIQRAGFTKLYRRAIQRLRAPRSLYSQGGRT